MIFQLQFQVCEECHRVQAKDYWRACVQVRQKCEYKKTLFSLEQMILKHDAAALVNFEYSFVFSLILGV